MDLMLSLPEIGRRIGFDLEQEQFSTKEGKTGRIFRVREYQEFPAVLVMEMKRLLTVYCKLGRSRTSLLLSYVYNTEPMKYGIRGQELDFSKVPGQRGTRYYELYVPVDKKVMKTIKENLMAYTRKKQMNLYLRPQNLVSEHKGH